VRAFVDEIVDPAVIEAAVRAEAGIQGIT
jgi:hypothetical protein